MCCPASVWGAVGAGRWRAHVDYLRSTREDETLHEVNVLAAWRFLEGNGARASPQRLPQALTRPRHGQHRNVLVRKFVTSGTIEEKIELMLAEKRQLADELIDGDGEVGLAELPDDELLDLVRLDVTRAAP